jgi:3D (Asp-Asp-Asp) domain-containing protein
MEHLQVWLAADPSRETIIAIERTIIACESILAVPLIGLRTSQLTFANAQSRVERLKQLIESGEHSSNELNAQKIEIHKSVHALREIAARWRSWASENSKPSDDTTVFTSTASTISTVAVDPEVLKLAEMIKLDTQLILDGKSTRSSERKTNYHRIQSKKNDNPNLYRAACQWLSETESNENKKLNVDSLRSA